MWKRITYLQGTKKVILTSTFKIHIKYMLSECIFSRGEYFHQKSKLFQDAPKFLKLFRSTKVTKVHKWVKLLDTLAKSSCFLCVLSLFFLNLVSFKNNFKTNLFKSLKLFWKWVNFLKLFRDDYSGIIGNIHPCNIL